MAFDLKQEIGYRGISRFNLRPEEWRNELKGMRGVRNRQEMSRGQFGAPINRVIASAFRRVKWRASPQVDSPIDSEAAQFLNTCLLDMNVPWATFVSQIVHNTNEQGFAVFETTYKERLGRQPPKARGGVPRPASKYDDGRIGWRHHNLRPASTIPAVDGFILDDHGGWTGITQQVVLPSGSIDRVTIPKEKLLLFRLEDIQGSPMGSGGIFDPAFQSWYYIRELTIIEAVVEERFGGVLIITLPENADTDPNDSNSDFSVAKDIVVNFRVDEQMGLVVPFGYKVDFRSPGEGSRRIHETIQRHMQDFYRVAMVEWMLLGTTKVGSWALSRDQSDIFLLALSGWLADYENVINEVAIPRLFQQNAFPGLMAYPVLRHTPLGRRDISELSQAWERLVKSGSIMPRYPEDEAWLRSELDAPPLPPEEKQAKVVQKGKGSVDYPEIGDALGIDTERYVTVPVAREDGGLGVVLYPRRQTKVYSGADMETLRDVAADYREVAEMFAEVIGDEE
jgi:hypothetical protein